MVYNQCCVLIGWTIDSEPIRAQGIILLNTYSMYSCIWVHVYSGTSDIQVYRFTLCPGEVQNYVATFLDATHQRYQEILWSWQPVTRKLHLRKADWEKPINIYFVPYPATGIWVFTAVTNLYCHFQLLITITFVHGSQGNKYSFHWHDYRQHHSSS